MEVHERRRHGLVGPIILIAIGLIFLLENLGLLGVNAWELIFRLWPVILIAVGLEILVGRRSMLASIVVLIITVGIIGVALYFMPVRAPFGQSFSSETIDQPLDGAKSANIQVDFGTGSLKIGALSDSAALIQGSASLSSGEQLTRSFQLSGDTAFYKLGTRNVNAGPFFPSSGANGSWNLNVNRDIPTQLTVNGGVGNSELDLSQLRVTNLNARLGVGKATITMPAAGRVTANVNGGVGDVEVVIPVGTEARIQADAGLGGVNVPSSYQHQGNVYTSPGYDAADNRVDLTVKGGVGRVSIQ
jgi:hypothetical protein